MQLVVSGNRDFNSRTFFRFRAFILSGCLILTTVGILSAAEPVLFADDFIEPGGVVQAVITGDPMDNLSVSLQDTRNRTLSRSEGFLWRSPAGRSISVALLGIPSTVTPGRYTLVMNADQGRAEWRLERSITVTDVVFPEQVIFLSDKMNNLYTDESERKKSEARKLWAILTAFNKTAIHHTESLIEPLAEGVPTAGFGDRRRYHIPDGSETSSVHFGLDLWAELGTPVKASGRGRIVLATERYLTGNTVIIEHLPGVYSLYYHMDSINVREGEMVNQGDRIGTVGETGFATGEHLHWELRVGATPVNPEPFLDAPLLDTNEMTGKMK
ncbi:MAG: peptidoglycan DD-metalloendopeptidase family protein [Spirochaetaceae bacterium]|nr:peptidoglycan DD-metalloendopeptidase family protein [Spirochaetaceae bacterium]